MGKAALVVFLRGCPLRCPHCHNHSLQTGENNIEYHTLASQIVCQTKGLQTAAMRLRANPRQINLEDASIRASSRPFVDAFVISGGEPLQQPEACARLLRLARSLGLVTGLETSGFYPDRLRRLLEKNIVDKIFLDLKTAIREPDYEMATGIKGVAAQVRKSLEICYQSAVPLDARSTIFPELPSTDQMKEIARILQDLGGQYPDNHLEHLVLQQGRPREGEPWFEPVSLDILQEMARAVGKKIPVKVRAPPVIKWAGEISEST